jgi:hypothetical protein
MEDAFFAREDALLLQRLRELDEAKRKKEALSAASGIADDAVLEHLAALNISSETLAALSLIPLVAVAWADGSINDKQRASVFSQAAEVGIRAGDISHELFEQWLAEPPKPALVSAWKEYISAFAATLRQDDRRALKAELLNRARTVAESAGGFLGIGNNMSQPEQDMLDELATAFPD